MDENAVSAGFDVVGADFVGRLSDGSGRMIGLCFQVSPGLLVTSARALAAYVRSAGPLTVATATGASMWAELGDLDRAHGLATLRPHRSAATVLGGVAPAYLRPGAVPRGTRVLMPAFGAGGYTAVDGVWEGAIGAGEPGCRVSLDPPAARRAIPAGTPVLEAAGGVVAVVSHRIDRVGPGRSTRPAIAAVGIGDLRDFLIGAANLDPFGGPDAQNPGDRTEIRSGLQPLHTSARVALHHAARFLDQQPASCAVADALLLGCATAGSEQPDGVAAGFLRELCLCYPATPGPSELLLLLTEKVGLRALTGRERAAAGAGAHDPRFEDLVRRAGYVAEQTDSPRIGASHLLAAALLAGDLRGGRGPLQALGIADAVVVDAFDRALAAASVAPRRAWLDLLRPLSGSPALAGGTDRDLVDFSSGIALSDDAIGVGPYATMLAVLVADRSTPMPLSIGVFGAWGSGKSYFMGLLREQVDALAGSGRPQYCSAVKQISFNAWHYSDTNLWASLGAKIFRDLAGPQTDIGRHRDRLEDEYAQLEVRKRAVDAAAVAARAAWEQLQTEVETAGAGGEEERPAVTIREVLRNLAKDPAMRSQLDRLWKRLGLRDEVEQVKALREQIDGAVPETKLLLRYLRRRAPVSAVVAICALILGAASWWASPRVGHWLLGSAVSSLVAALGTVLALMPRLRKAITSFTKIVGTVTEGLAQDFALRTAELTAVAQAKASAAQTKAQAAQDDVDKIDKQMLECERQRAELEPTRRMADFLDKRRNGGEYADHLGLVATLRRDLEDLVALLDDWRTVSESEFGPTRRRPRIDRIVLYIDDLDRCGPAQVFTVLQAVHLLLALDLFTVVVGVDPEWLLRSIANEYPGMFEAGDAASGRADVAPDRYLEKIFNIPIALPPLSVEAAGNLVRTLVVRHGAGNRSRLRRWEGEEAGPAPEHESAGARTRPAPAGDESVAAEPGSELAVLRSGREPVPPQPVTEAELAMLEALSSLVRQPREIKRLVNLYRLIRSTRDLAPDARFLGDREDPGEYQAVIILLGLLSAEPRLFASLVEAPPVPGETAGGLMHRPDEQSWTEFAAGLTPRPVCAGWVNDIVGALPAADTASWRRLAEGVAAAGDLVELSGLSVFRAWAERVRLFRFTTT